MAGDSFVLIMDSTITPRQDVLRIIDDIGSLKDELPKDVVIRRKLSNVVHELALALESPLETVRRISFSVKPPPKLTILQPTK